MVCSIDSSRSSASISWISVSASRTMRNGCTETISMPGEEQTDVGGDDLLEPDEIMMVGDRPILAGGARGAFDGDEARQGAGHFETREFLVALLVTDDDGKVQAEIRNMGEGMCQVQGERREDGIDRLAEVGVRLFLLGFAQFLVVQNMDARLVQLGQEFALEALMGSVEQFEGALADGGELFARGHAVGGDLDDARLDLLAEPRDAHHEELVHVGAEDGEEFDALEERVVLVQRLFEDAVLELQQAQLTVDEEFGVEGLSFFRHGFRILGLIFWA